MTDGHNTVARTRSMDGGLYVTSKSRLIDAQNVPNLTPYTMAP